MEHNFTFNYIDEMNATHDILNFFFQNQAVLRQLVGVTTLENFPYLERYQHYPISLEDIIGRMETAIASAIEEEKPKYEHRYSVINGYDGTVLKEFDELDNAFEYYKSLYADEYSIHCRADDNDYVLVDNKHDITVTDRVPYLEFEYEWEADLRVRLDGRTVYEPSDYVMEEIAEQFAGGDTDGYVEESIGDVDWDDIDGWEEEHDKEQSNETAEANTEAVSSSTEESAEESATETDNAWHVY